MFSVEQIQKLMQIVTIRPKTQLYYVSTITFVCANLPQNKASIDENLVYMDSPHNINCLSAIAVRRVCAIIAGQCACTFCVHGQKLNTLYSETGHCCERMRQQTRSDTPVHSMRDLRL